MNVYTVTAERGTSGVWVLECEELGVVSQAEQLGQAKAAVVEAIAYQSGLETNAFEVEVVPVSSERTT
ncbi:hypothetical protein [Corynebacterium sp. Marseille-P4321]|uniref:hypothetical protein n=1 Tax=Corynebacterium sp. Marseille-P4321 TaxID=2736603 RepID=UPI00158BDE7B|nr:hypothetical protein [Corynebacterium sp. Marseille-P4321]